MHQAGCRTQDELGEVDEVDDEIADTEPGTSEIVNQKGEGTVEDEDSEASTQVDIEEPDEETSEGQEDD